MCKRSDFQKLIDAMLEDPALLEDLSVHYPDELVSLWEEILGRNNKKLTPADNERIVYLLKNDPMLERDDYMIH